MAAPMAAPLGEIVIAYEYRDAAGVVLYQVVRFKPRT